MRRPISIRHFLIVVLAIVVIVGGLWVIGPLMNMPENNQSAVKLQVPPFILDVHAVGASSASNFLESEAGISAYMNSDYGINLDRVRGAFKTIEVETPEYIIGSVAVADNPEWKDVHAYINTNGWIVTYYSKDDPVGKILNWPKYDNSDRSGMTTMLEDTIAYLTSEASVPYSDVTYYHFQYPNATQMMFIIEHTPSGDDSFEVTLPTNYSFFERSWSLKNSRLYLDDAEIGYSYQGQAFGKLSATQLDAGVSHTILVHRAWEYGYGALVLVYRGL